MPEFTPHKWDPFETLSTSTALIKFTNLLNRLTGLAMALNSPSGVIANRTSPSKESPLCRLIASKPEGFRRCRECDRAHHAVALRSQKPLVYRCHAGFYDIAVPLIYEGQALGTLSSGQVLSAPPDKEGFKKLQKRLSWLGVSEAKLRLAYEGAPFLPKSHLSNVAQLLSLFALQLCEYERLARQLANRIDRMEIQKGKKYMDEHFNEITLSLRDIASAAGLSKAHFSHRFKKETGSTVMRYLQGKRVHAVKRRLAMTHDSITEISFDCGFASLTHLNRVFRAFEGCSPKSWRRKRIGDTP